MVCDRPLLTAVSSQPPAASACGMCLRRRPPSTRCKLRPHQRSDGGAGPDADAPGIRAYPGRTRFYWVAPAAGRNGGRRLRCLHRSARQRGLLLSHRRPPGAGVRPDGLMNVGCRRLGTGGVGTDYRVKPPARVRRRPAGPGFLSGGLAGGASAAAIDFGLRRNDGCGRRKNGKKVKLPKRKRCRRRNCLLTRMTGNC